MSDFLTVMGLAALPAAANFLGGGLAEVFRVSGRVLSLALHLAAGIVLAVVGLELMPEALQAKAVGAAPGFCRWRRRLYRLGPLDRLRAGTARGQ